ncbi:MAG: hypothetical protein CVU84_13240 [Firmicutes bacterium HGW-Firmicutes-1]|jgi:hypothetical protein|nr:MAG: hypothetical protein CVU84_13240 [Firmicutes bacterium HGW-Firmicutes-1]
MEACIICTIIFLFVLTLAVLWFKGKKKLVKKIILELVALAEEKYGSGTGEIKLASVLLEIYQEYPWLEYLETWVIKWINEAVKFMNKSQ